MLIYMKVKGELGSSSMIHSVLPENNGCEHQKHSNFKKQFTDKILNNLKIKTFSVTRKQLLVQSDHSCRPERVHVLSGNGKHIINAYNLPEYIIAVTLYLVCVIGRQKYTQLLKQLIHVSYHYGKLVEAKENQLYLNVNKHRKAQTLP